MKRIAIPLLSLMIIFIAVSGYSYDYEYYSEFKITDATLAPEICNKKAYMLAHKNFFKVAHSVPADLQDLRAGKYLNYYAVAKNPLGKIGEVSFFHNGGRMYSAIFQYTPSGKLVRKILFYPENELAYIKTYYYDDKGRISHTYYFDKGLYYQKYRYVGGRLKKITWYSMENIEGQKYLERQSVILYDNGVVKRKSKEPISEANSRVIAAMEHYLKRMMAMKVQIEKSDKESLLNSVIVKMTPYDYAEMLLEIDRYKKLIIEAYKKALKKYSEEEISDFKYLLETNKKLKKKIDIHVEKGVLEGLEDQKNLYFEEVDIEGYPITSSDVMAPSGEVLMKPEHYAIIVVDSLKDQELLEQLLKTHGYTMEDYLNFQEKLKEDSKLRASVDELISEYYIHKQSKNKEQ